MICFNTLIMRKKLFLGAATVLALAAIIGGYLYIDRVNDSSAKFKAAAAHESIPTADSNTAFRNFLIKQASQKHVESDEMAGDLNSWFDGKVVLDTASKTYTQSVDLECSIGDANGKASMSMTVQTENASEYVQLNDIQGNVEFRGTGTINLATLYANDIGNWYTISDSDSAMQTEITAGAYIFNTGIVAPDYDAQKIAEGIIKNKAITYSVVSEKDGKFVLKLTAHKDTYQQAVSQIFPDISSEDAVISSLFNDKTTIDDTVTIAADGSSLAEKPVEDNPCPLFVQLFIGVSGDSLPKQVNGDVVAKSQGSVNITPVTDPQPIESMTGRQSIYQLHTAPPQTNTGIR
jgi:hypothetical protein